MRSSAAFGTLGRVRPLPSGFVTFMFTDVVGSTRLHHELGEHYVDLIEAHNQLLSDAAEAHGGRVVKASR